MPSPPPSPIPETQRHRSGFYPGDFWQRVTAGLELQELWAQFKSDAHASYRLYQRDVDAKIPQQTKKPNFLHTVWEFTWAVLDKLSPARRVLLLLAVVTLLFGAGGFDFNFDAGAPRAVTFDFHLAGAAMLFILLMLEVADRVVMKRDLEIARDIQSWLLPAEPPVVPGISLAFTTRPANTVAGDYYDVFARPANGSEEPRFLLAVADVAGKSIPAALLMATFQASLKTLSETGCSLGGLIAGVNRYACSNSQNGRRFTTAFLAEFDHITRTVTYINAGHNAPMLRRKSGAVERLTNGGLPVGILADAPYEPGSAVLEPGDWLVIFTDGLVEAENEGAAEYGEERLMTVLQGGAADTPQDLLRRMIADVDAFVGATPQHDDITCLLIKAA